MKSTHQVPLLTAPPKARARRDYRLLVLVAVSGSIVLLGAVVSLLTGQTPSASIEKVAPPKLLLSDIKNPIANGRSLRAEVEPPVPQIDPKDPQGNVVKQIFKEAGAQIKTKRYDEAIRTLHEARPLVQKHAESYLLLASALEGKKDYAAARDFFEAAIDRNPYLSEAYWGYATTSESLGDLAAALGAMRNYLHTEPNLDPKRLKVAQARSAIWEWESQLERGPWGPTKGIPPGFTREELKRDGRGVGIKMPIPGTEKVDGSMKYEIKHQDKFKLFKLD
jgi:tetratricopeptide (TPR) repeat protein